MTRNNIRGPVFIPDMKNVSSSAKQLVFIAMFASLCCVTTIAIAIPLPYGYCNVGDIFVLLAGWFLGPLGGCVSAAVGSALADVWSGYAIYAPATFFIKGCVAILAYFTYALCKKWIKNARIDFLPRLFSTVFAECVMVLGYFLFETALYGWTGALLSLVGNITQGSICAVGSVILISCLYPIKAIKNTFPRL